MKKLITSERLNPKSILICNLALRKCGKKVVNNPESLMNHFIKNHGWRKIPELVQKDISEKKPHPHTKKIMTRQTYLQLLVKEPEQWWWDNQFYWKDIRNLHFLHKTNTKLKSLRCYYHS